VKEELDLKEVASTRRRREMVKTSEDERNRNGRWCEEKLKGEGITKRQI
jgi:hypothetical protein